MYVNHYDDDTNYDRCNSFALCEYHMEDEKNYDSQSPWLKYSFYLPIVTPDNATPEQIVCVEILLHRFCRLFTGEAP